jgi:hypothetical protein
VDGPMADLPPCRMLNSASQGEITRGRSTHEVA